MSSAICRAKPRLSVTAQTTAKPTLPGALGLASDPQAMIDHRYLWDVQGNLLLNQNKDAIRSFAYDGQDRLIASGTSSTAQTKQTKQAVSASYERYFYDAAGNRLLAQEGITDQADTKTHTVKSVYNPNTNRWQGESNTDEDITDSTIGQAHYDASGQPERIGQREYVWDAMGKLLEVRQVNRTLASYRYNYMGERISKRAENGQTGYLYEGGKLVAEINDKGQVTRQYLYLADQPIALIDTPQGGTLNHAEASQLAQITADIATAWHAWFNKTEPIAYLHNNHLGATELVTNERAMPVWQADYSPYGNIIHATTYLKVANAENKTAFVFNLRLPGQYEDAETGLYYNDHRYYDPQRGQYLTPDPLGLRGGINSYAYVANNPLKYVDPTGLILFAFDGTGNSETESISNVFKFYQTYDQDANGKKYYITGIGTTNQDMSYKGNQLNGDGFDQRLDLGFSFLDKFIGSDTGTSTVDIDVVGFSRGAAEARVWINQLIGKMKKGAYTANGKTRCVNLRFEGLWDTVSHLGYLGGNDSKYDFSIPDAVKYVASANALNEYRGGATNFNFRSIKSNAGQADSGTRIEKGFIGAHSDIGGGYGTGDLSDVALMWMIKQANNQGIKFNNKAAENGWDTVSNPVLHDSSNNLLNGASDGGPTAISEDRNVIYADGTVVRQRKATSGTMTYADTVKYITYKANPLTFDLISGTVDAKAYIQWLKANGYNINVTAQ